MVLRPKEVKHILLFYRFIGFLIRGRVEILYRFCPVPDPESCPSFTPVLPQSDFSYFGAGLVHFSATIIPEFHPHFTHTLPTFFGRLSVAFGRHRFFKSIQVLSKNCPTPYFLIFCKLACFI